MKYNHDYYVMCLTLPVDKRSRHVKKVKGSDLITILNCNYSESPEMFIYKSDLNDYNLSDSKTGLLIYSNSKLKNVLSWLDDPANQKRILEAYNKPFMSKQKQIFNDLVSQAAA